VTVEPSGAHRVPAAPVSTPILGRVRLGPAEAAIFETFVIPRYLALFGDLAIEMIAESEEAQVVHLYCRTGYPNRGVSLKLPGATIVGTDSSNAALEVARVKATSTPEMVTDYRLAEEGAPVPLPPAAFSHALTMHPLANPDDRGVLFAEMARLLAPHGQALIALPLRGSFQEILDLIREFAVKVDDHIASAAVERAAQLRPTVEVMTGELERAGFDYVDVTLRPATLSFQSGRDFFEDPIARLLILPELRLDLGYPEVDRALAYVRDAIDKYWSDGTFELTVNVACATGRRV
jgi:SAM-dependent methyltransferase